MNDLATWLLEQIPGHEKSLRRAEQKVYNHPAAQPWMLQLVAFLVAECDTKRRRIDWCVEVIGDRDLSTYGQFGALKDDPQALAVTLAVEVLRLEALPYAARPGYREEWRP